MDDLHRKMPQSFHALHALTHERDFVVRVNVPTQNFAMRILTEEMKKDGIPLLEDPSLRCPVCAAGFSPAYLQPTSKDQLSKY